MTDHRKLGIVKLGVCLAAVTTVVWHLFDGHFIASQTAVMMLLAILSGIGSADALVNDILPPEYEAPQAEEWKYLAFIGIAGCQLSLIYAAVISDRLDWQSFRYAVEATVAVGVAVLDLRSRYQPGRRHEQNPLPDQAA